MLPLPVGARNRKGDKFLKEGREAEVRKQWGTALDLYEKALLEDPGDPSYMMAARRVRFQAAMTHVNSGQRLRTEGQLEAALAEFQKAYAIDPSLSIAEQELKRTRDMIQRAKDPNAAATAPEDKGMTPHEKTLREMEEKAERMLPVPELRPITRQLNSPLKINNQSTRTIFETIGKLAGINVVFDPEYQTQGAGGRDRFTVDLSNATLEEALDYVAVQTKSFWKPLSPNTIFITNDNVTKRRDYEDYVVKVLYVKNVTTVQELQEMSVTIRSITEIRRAYTYNSLWAIVVRGTADQVSLAEKLLQDLDKPKPEVVVDVVVMEANRGKVRDLAASLTSSGSPGLNIPIFHGARRDTNTGDDDDDDDEEPTEEAGIIRLNKIASLGLGDFSTIVPGALLQAVMSDGQTRILQQPQVRAVELQKASLKIGDRVPYATGSFQPGVGGAGLNPLVSTQFNYIDTGVNIDIVPKVHGRNEISLHVEIDLNNVSREVKLADLSQPVITQKKIVHDIRLREGEVNLLGGLISAQETRTISGIPFLASIPIIGRFFGPEHVEVNRGEMLIALIPHVVRAPEFNESNLRGVSAGNDANLKLNYSARPERNIPTSPAPTAPAAPGQVSPNPSQQPAAPPSTPGATAPAAPAPAPASPAPPPAGSVPTAGGTQLLLNPTTSKAAINSPIGVQLMVENVSDLFTAPVRIKFDSKVLRLTNVRAGNMINGDGAKINLTENTQNDTGESTITLNRLPGSGSVSGSGALLELTFQAIGRGSANVSVVDVSLKNSQLQPIAVPLPSAVVIVE